MYHNGYIISLLPIQNVQGDHVAFLIFYSKNSELDTIAYAYLQHFLLTLIATTLLFSALFMLYKKNVLMRQEAISHANELARINSSLEERVQEEVRQNREKDKQMLAQNRLAQMGEMIAMIAHQWRQPLASINATTSTLLVDLKMQAFDPAFFEKSLYSINSFSEYLSHTIDDFRNFFKADNKRVQTTLEEVSDSAIKLVSMAFKDANIAIEQVYNANKKLCCYKNEIQQVLVNLLMNSRDALVSNNIADPKVRIETSQFDDTFMIRVVDNGGGIPANIIDKVFDPYFSTKKDKNGTGLGLYVSKTIVEDHCQGKLSVANNEDGVIFSIVLKNSKEGVEHE
jgi:C4-dicarboxylate-specific signal transduction histidine kinase